VTPARPRPHRALRFLVVTVDSDSKSDDGLGLSPEESLHRLHGDGLGVGRAAGAGELETESFVSQIRARRAGVTVTRAGGERRGSAADH
jgi:hypothetical protein